jgi:hypothetical protein
VSVDSGVGVALGRIVFAEEVEVTVRITETGTPERLTKTRRALLHATARVMHASGRSTAVPAGKVDHPLRAFSFVSPTDRLEESATDAYRVGEAGDPFRHFSITV